MESKIQGLQPLTTGIKPGAKPSRLDGIGGPSFKETMESLKPQQAKAGLGAAGLEKLKFSNHAVERMRARGMSFSAGEMQKIESAVERAREKGSKDTLVLGDTSAMIVSVKNNTVVTVMDKGNLKENVFTNIDSTVFA